METLEYLEQVKKQLGIESDYALAKALKISHSAICGYRAGTSHISDEVAARIALILKKNPLEPIAKANYQRAKTDESRLLWATVLEKISLGFESLVLRASPRRSLLSAR